jgi:predicted phage replisome organizer
MSDVKWIKLATDLFNNRKIKQIRRMPSGKDVVLIWVQILCLAGDTNDNGLVYFAKDIPYTDEMLSTEFDEDVNIVRLALKIFQKFNMLEVVDNFLLVSNWEKYQNVASLEKIREQNRLRVAKHREKQKELAVGCNVTSNDNVTTGNAIDKEEDKDKDKEEDKDIDIDIERENTPNKSEAPRSRKRSKHKYGPFKNVLLTEEEFNKLHKDYSNADEAIQYMSEYCEMHGKTYKNFNLAIRKWVFEALKEKGRKSYNNPKVAKEPEWMQQHEQYRQQTKQVEVPVDPNETIALLESFKNNKTEGKNDL